MTIVVSTSAQQQSIIDANAPEALKIASLAQGGSFNSNFTFFAGFDGTNNDQADLGSSDFRVGQLSSWTACARHRRPAIDSLSSGNAA